MATRTSLLTTTLLAALLLPGSAALAQNKIDWGKVDGDKPAGDKPAAEKADGDKPAENQPPVEVNPELTGDYIDMAKQCRLSADQQDKIVKLLKAKDVAVKQWEHRNQKRIEYLRDEINEAEDAKDKEKERKKLERFMQGRDKVAMQYDMRAYRVLTREQLQQWYEYKLWQLIDADLRLVTPPLSKDQNAEAKEITARYANRIPAGTQLDKQPGIKMTVHKEIYGKVLTKDQKKSFQQMMQSRPRF